MSAAAHVPALAAGADGGSPRRSLLLAGGGMRVAYQAGALLALHEAGLRFAHGDGTSGGTMNLAMILSGVGPAEACERWRTLNPRGFASPPALRWLLRGPPLPALGSSDGLRRRVFGHLGVDPERIRAAEGIAGTFNVCDYTAKANVAIAHADVDLDVLVAGVSLPVVSPAVRRDGRVLVDSVWIKDVNVAEAIRRGAEELWLIWCIGNHGVWRDGAFQQYVHMIEISANSSLQEELGRVPADVPLHVIRPRAPLPLDPDFFLGRIDGATLVAMGYRDAAGYLDGGPPAGGLSHDGSATRMEDPRPGIGFRERLRGSIGGAPLELRLGWEVDDLAAFIADPASGGRLVADATHPALGVAQPARAGEFSVRDGQVSAELRFNAGTLSIERTLGAWDRVQARLGDAEGELARAGPPVALTLHARGVGSAREGARAQARFWAWLLRARS